MSKNWIPASQIYGQPLGIIDVAYLNGTYLANPSSHPGGTESFQTNLISADFEHWQNRVNSPVRPYKIEDVRFFSTDEYIFAMGSKITETSKKLVGMRSTNGFDWDDYYESTDESLNYKINEINVVSGLHILSCTGCIFVSNDAGKSWNKIALPEEYKDAVVGGSAFNSHGIHILLKKGKQSYLAKIKSGNDLDVIVTPWQMESVSMTSNNHQIIVSGRIKNQSFIIFFVDDPEAYEILSIPEKPTEESFVSVYDMQWINNEWYFAVSKEFYN